MAKYLIVALIMVGCCVAAVFYPTVQQLDGELKQAYCACGGIVLLSWIFGMLLDRLDRDPPRIE